MEDLINEQILENIYEGFEISQSIVEEEDNVYPQIRYVIRDENNELVRHDWKSSWSLKRDAEQALSEIVHQRFEEQSQ
jgi:hypothetical protein